MKTVVMVTALCLVLGCSEGRYEPGEISMCTCCDPGKDAVPCREPYNDEVSQVYCRHLPVKGIWLKVKVNGQLVAQCVPMMKTEGCCDEVIDAPKGDCNNGVDLFQCRRKGEPDRWGCRSSEWGRHRLQEESDEANRQMRSKRDEI